MTTQVHASTTSATTQTGAPGPASGPALSLPLGAVPLSRPVLELLLAALPDGVVLSSGMSRILWANAAYCEMTGYELTDLVGRSPAPLRSVAAEGATPAAIWEALASCGYFKGRVVHRRADGSRLHAELTVVRAEVATSADEPLFIGVLRDVGVEVVVEERLRELLELAEEARETTIEALAGLAEQRDDCTGTHLQRVEGFCFTMIRWVVARHPEWLPVWARDARLVARCAILHDIGKVGVPDSVLLKAGPLSAEEQASMRRHPLIGAELIDRLLALEPESEYLRIAREIILCHHERHDGGGYPLGLSGAAVPFVAQLATVADVFDALTSPRPYKPAYSFDAAAQWIHEHAGTAFDPRVVEAFVAVRDELRAVHAECAPAEVSGAAIGPSSMRPPRSGAATEPSGTATEPTGIATAATSTTAPRSRAAAVPRPPLRSESGVRRIAAPESVPRPSLAGSPVGVPVVPPGGEAQVFARALAQVACDEVTGEVVLRHGQVESRVLFHGGRVVWIHTPSDQLPITTAVVRELGVPVRVVRAVVAQCRHSGDALADALVTAAHVDRPRLRALIARHLRAKLDAMRSTQVLAVSVSRTASVRASTFAFDVRELGVDVEGLARA